jgi:hypothetical protein
VAGAKPNDANQTAAWRQWYIEHGGIFHDVCKELKRQVIMLWPINRQRDSIELLKNVIDSNERYESIYAITNTYFGEPEKFQRYYLFNKDER